MKREYSCPQLFAETFVANEYCGACVKPEYGVDPTEVKCISQGHQNTQYNTMFLDTQTACIVKFVPNVGDAKDDKFYTQFEACAYVDGCNRQNWMADHPNDKKLSLHKSEHKSNKYGTNNGAFINHDTVVDLSLAQKFNLS